MKEISGQFADDSGAGLWKFAAPTEALSACAALGIEGVDPTSGGSG